MYWLHQLCWIAWIKQLLSDFLILIVIPLFAILQISDTSAAPVRHAAPSTLLLEQRRSLFAVKTPSSNLQLHQIGEQVYSRPDTTGWVCRRWSCSSYLQLLIDSRLKWQPVAQHVLLLWICSKNLLNSITPHARRSHWKHAGAGKALKF